MNFNKCLKMPSWTSGPKVKGGACYFQEGGHLKQRGGSVNDTTLVIVVGANDNKELYLWCVDIY